MKQAWPWFIAVGIGYVLMIVGVLYMVPQPWNLAVALVVLLMALRFVFTVKKVSQMGVKHGPK